MIDALLIIFTHGPTIIYNISCLHAIYMYDSNGFAIWIKTEKD